MTEFSSPTQSRTGHRARERQQGRIKRAAILTRRDLEACLSAVALELLELGLQLRIVPLLLLLWWMSRCLLLLVVVVVVIAVVRWTRLPARLADLFDLVRGDAILATESLQPEQLRLCVVCLPQQSAQSLY